MIRFLTAGESHGKALTSIIEGFPSNIPLKKDYFDFYNVDLHGIDEK